MCGIAGILRIHDPAHAPPPPPHAAIPEHWLDVLDESVRHRGPDGQGRFRDRVTRPDGATLDVALVHRRLSIIDHARGGQPMVQGGDARLFGPTTPAAAPPAGPQDYRTRSTHVCPACREQGDGLVAVVFNGCIYNHRELRRELELAGHEFESGHSDTEVILHGAREWSYDLISHLDGMFAFGLWDRSTGALLIARDAFGEKPLYARAELSDIVAFGSSYASMLRLDRRLPPSDDAQTFDIPRQLSGWIQFGWNQEARLTPGIRSTTPGHASVLSRENPGTKDVASIQWPHEVLNPSQENITPEQVDEAIRAAVWSRLEADVPLGCFLSGGLDSSLVAKYASEQRPDLATYTVRMPAAGFDESAAAASVAKHLGLKHTVLDCDPDPAQDLVRLIPQLGLPFGDSSLLPTHWVSRAARNHVRVALTGDGGDELFLGYDRNRAIRLLDKLGRCPKPLRSALPSRRLGGRTPASRLARMERLMAALSRFGYKEIVAIFPTPMFESLGFSPRHGDHWGMISTRDGFTEPTARRFDLLFYLPEDLLRKSDTASMACGLELRAPLLAREVAQPAINAPLRTLMPHGRRKGLLRAVARKHLPKHIVDRPKQGFAIPIGEWFRSDYGRMRQLLYDHLESADPFPGLPAAGAQINMHFVRRMLREHDAAGESSLNPWHGRDHSQRLYMLLVLSIWARWLATLTRPA